MEKKKPARKTTAAPAKRPRRSREDILARIFEAAEEEFKRHGYLGATTAAIARKAEVTEAQLFRYFGSKQTLFREVIFKPIDRHFSEFMETHKLSGAKALSDRETYHLYTSELHRFISDNAEMLTSLLVAQAYETGDRPDLGPIQNLKLYFDHGAATLQETRQGAPIYDPQIMVRIAFATVLSCVIFKRWIFPKGLAREKEITAALNQFILSAMIANFEDK